MKSNYSKVSKDIRSVVRFFISLFKSVHMNVYIFKYYLHSIIDVQ